MLVWCENIHVGVTSIQLSEKVHKLWQPKGTDKDQNMKLFFTEKGSGWNNAVPVNHTQTLGILSF